MELVLIDEGYAYDVSHPFHIHGHSFYVVAMERHGATPSHIGPAPGPGNFITREQVVKLNTEGKIRKNLQNPPLKDNVAVPDAGFTIIRFHADNVGYWLFHCHMAWHNHLGMGVIIKVSFAAKMRLLKKHHVEQNLFLVLRWVTSKGLFNPLLQDFPSVETLLAVAEPME